MRLTLYLWTVIYQQVQHVIKILYLLPFNDSLYKKKKNSSYTYLILNDVTSFLFLFFSRNISTNQSRIILLCYIIHAYKISR